MTLFNQVKLLSSTSRPLGWVIAPAIRFSGLVHSSTTARTIPGILFAAALTLPTCLSEISWQPLSPATLLTWKEVTFGVNDVYDIESDIQNPRKNNRWTYGTALSRGNVQFLLLAARISTAIVILLALPASASSPCLLACTMAFLCLTWSYSTPPIRLKERPVLD